mmetsp:Transcript_5863/g.12828  ORF Transcript_5863/g.12828 Transcript_5863/m.12828 type:complete len:206 (-) Transcript_5863:1480-2097(-)
MLHPSGREPDILLLLHGHHRHAGAEGGVERPSGGEDGGVAARRREYGRHVTHLLVRIIPLVPHLHVEEVLHPPVAGYILVVVVHMVRRLDRDVKRQVIVPPVERALFLLRRLVCCLLGRVLRGDLLDRRRVDQEEEILLPLLRLLVVGPEYSLEDVLRLRVEVSRLVRGARLEEIGGDLPQVARRVDCAVQGGLELLPLMRPPHL